MSIEVNNHCININSVNRDLLANRNPMKFTVWMNDDHGSSSINKSFDNIKFINFEYIVFPKYIKMLKAKMKVTNSLFTDIITVMGGTVTVNNQITLNNKTYEICNKVGSIVNFTIDGILTTSYEYINDTTVNIYTPININTMGNEIQYISLQPCDNKYIYSTKNKNFFKYVFPKLNKTSDMFLSTKKSYIEFKKSELLSLKRIFVELLDSQCEPIIIDNLDYEFQSHNIKGLHEDVDYTDPSYYLRHPLNPNFQIDIFLKIGQYEQGLLKQSSFL
jgi:hypothetical protein